jgi:hypothetical protein
LGTAARKLFDATLQLLRLAPQQLLVPALLQRQLLLTVQCRQFLLASRQFLQPAERLFHLAVALLLRNGRLSGLVLVLFGVQLQIKQAFQIPGAASRPAAAAESDLNPAERGFGPEQVLESFLFVRQSLSPLAGLQLLGRRFHGLGGLPHVFGKALEFLVGGSKLAALDAAGQRTRLVAKSGLHFAQEPGVLGGLLPVAGRAQLVPGGCDDLLLPLRNAVLLLALHGASCSHLL